MNENNINTNQTASSMGAATNVSAATGFAAGASNIGGAAGANTTATSAGNTANIANTSAFNTGNVDASNADATSVKDESAKKTGRYKAFTIAGIILCVLLIPIVIINCTLIAKQFTNSNEVPSIGGIFPMIVLTDSMKGTFDGGSLIICGQIDAKDVKTGDIICFFDPSGNGTTTTTHRVQQILTDDSGERSFVTKGDANNTVDATPVPASNLVGIYRFHIAGLGSVIMFMQTTPGLIIFAVLPILVLVGYDVIRRRLYDKKVDAETSALEEELEELRQGKVSVNQQEQLQQQSAVQQVNNQQTTQEIPAQNSSSVQQPSQQSLQQNQGVMEHDAQFAPSQEESQVDQVAQNTDNAADFQAKFESLKQAVESREQVEQKAAAAQQQSATEAAALFAKLEALHQANGAASQNAVAQEQSQKDAEIEALKLQVENMRKAQEQEQKDAEIAALKSELSAMRQNSALHQANQQQANATQTIQQPEVQQFQQLAQNMAAQNGMFNQQAQQAYQQGQNQETSVLELALENLRQNSQAAQNSQINQSSQANQNATFDQAALLQMAQQLAAQQSVQNTQLGWEQQLQQLLQQMQQSNTARQMQRPQQFFNTQQGIQDVAFQTSGLENPAQQTKPFAAQQVGATQQLNAATQQMQPQQAAQQMQQAQQFQQAAQQANPQMQYQQQQTAQQQQTKQQTNQDEELASLRGELDALHAAEQQKQKNAEIAALQAQLAVLRQTQQQNQQNQQNAEIAALQEELKALRQEKDAACTNAAYTNTQQANAQQANPLEQAAQQTNAAVKTMENNQQLNQSEAAEKIINAIAAQLHSQRANAFQYGGANSSEDGRM